MVGSHKSPSVEICHRLIGSELKTARFLQRKQMNYNDMHYNLFRPMIFLRLKSMVPQPRP